MCTIKQLEREIEKAMREKNKISQKLDSLWKQIVDKQLKKTG
jgi:hypothetical protein